MLQGIRDRTQGWMAGVIISLLILSFALWGIHGYLSGGTTTTIVAKVNGTEITKTQLAVAYERMRRQLQMQFSSNYQLPQQAEANLKERSLQFLVNIQVLKQGSLDQGYRISLPQVDSLLGSMPEFQVNGQFSTTRFEQILQTTLYNANDFIELIKTKLLIDQPKLGIVFSSFALPNEIKNTIGLVNEERAIQYLVVPFKSMKQSIKMNEDKILSYYKQHESEFRTPEQVSIEYLELSLKDLMAAIHPTDEMIKKFYSDNSGSYTKPMQWKLESLYLPLADHASHADGDLTQKKIDEIYQEVKNGKEFAVLKKTYSLNNSDMSDKIQGWLTLNQVPTELQTSLSTLHSKGQMSDLIKLANGFVLLKVLDIKEPEVLPLIQVWDKVKEALVRQLAEEKFATLREKLANLTYEHPESLEPAAKTLGLTIKTSPLFEKDKSDKGLLAHAKVREAAFSDDVINLKNNSDIIQVSGDTILSLRIKNHMPSTVLSFNAVRKQIQDKLIAAELDSQTAALAQEIKQKLQRAIHSENIIKAYQLTWVHSGWIGRHSLKINPAILNASFSMPRPSSQDNTASYAIAKISEGYAIIALTAVRDGVIDSHNEQYHVFDEQLQNAQGLMEY